MATCAAQNPQRRLNPPCTGLRAAYNYAEIFKDMPAELLAGTRDIPAEFRDILPDRLKDQLPGLGSAGCARG
jgi:hypothetical protein